MDNNNNVKEIKIGEGLELYEGDLGFKAKVEKKFENINFLIISVVIVLLIMVAGLVFAYWEFTYNDSRKTREEIIENKFKMLELEKDSQSFKNCLKNGSWNKCF